MGATMETRHAAGEVQAGREYLSFVLGESQYGIDILKVQEIRTYETPTRIANTPPFIKGVMNLRGNIVPIIDLRVKFGLDCVEEGGWPWRHISLKNIAFSGGFTVLDTLCIKLGLATSNQFVVAVKE